MGLAVYYIQSVVETFKAELDKEGSDWQRDPQEKQVLTAVQEDGQKASQWTSQTCWNVQPRWVQFLLITGSLLVTLAGCILINPVSKPFKKFAISDRISEFPGGPLAVVGKAGWLAIGVMCAALACLTAFQVW